MFEFVKEEMCDICHCMWQQGWVAANDGNVSALLDDGSVVCTPSGVSKREIKPEMLLVVDREGHILEGSGKVSTELPMHLRCYAERPDVRAVVHAHPPMSTTFAVADKPLDDYAMIESICVLGSVPVAPYAMPGTDEVPESIAPYLKNHDAILLRAHGSLTVGCNLKTAYYRMETLEHIATITLFSTILGGAKDLPRDEIDRLIERRTSFYKMTGAHPGYKKLT
jgi:L-fuculose-phosphate aldolase